MKNIFLEKIQASSLAFPIIVIGTFKSIPIALQQKTKVTLSNNFFLPRIVVGSSLGKSTMYHGANKKKKLVSSIL